MSFWDGAHSLVDVAPFLRREFEFLVAEWAPEEVPPTIVFMSFADTFAAQATLLSDAELASLWAGIERCLAEGNEMLCDAVATGFLECVLNKVNLLSVEDWNRTTSLLGPETRKYCLAWDGFTGVRTPGITP